MVPATLRRALATALCFLVFSAHAEWSTDYAASQEQAQAGEKDLLLFFTGSDWCVWCVKLEKEVFQDAGFLAAADQRFSRVMLDYPNKTPQPEPLKQQNARLLERYGIKAYPTVLLTDAAGTPYASTAYQPGGPEAYLEHLETLARVRVLRDEHLAAAEQANGLEKARHLHAALQAVGEKLALSFYGPTIDRICELDADNQAGLREHYTTLRRGHDLAERYWSTLALGRDKPEQAVAGLREIAADAEAPMDMRQAALANAGNILQSELDAHQEARQAFLDAIALAPDSQLSEHLRERLDTEFPEPGDAEPRAE